VAAGVGGRAIVEISDPGTPLLLATLPTERTTGSVALADTLAYVLDRNALRVVSVANPAAPWEIASYATLGNGSGLLVSGHWAFVGDDRRGLWVLDIADPRQARDLGVLETKNAPQAIAGRGSRVYLAENWAGVEIYEFGVDPPRRAGFFDSPGEAVALRVGADGLIHLGDGAGGVYLLREE
jgi:hypothetical protein